MDSVDSCPVVSLLAKGGILYGVPAADKQAAIVAAIERMTLPAGVDRDLVVTEVLHREAMASTATGQGIAIPHPQNASTLRLPESVLALAFLSPPVEFDAPDGQPVHALFVVLSHNAALHLRLLAQLGRTLQETSVQDALARQSPPQEIFDVLHRASAAIAARRVTLTRPRQPDADPVRAS